jgi:hypothetical protein
MTVNPSPAIDHSSPPRLKAWAVIENAPPQDKVDLILLGDGYTQAEMDTGHHDARRSPDLLFAASPFKEHRRDFNVWAVDTPAEESGVSRPSDGVYHRSPLGAWGDTFSPLTTNGCGKSRRPRRTSSSKIVVNGRKYGGGGIFNLYATVASDYAFTPYIFVHEFGHHFAGLTDEHYTSDVSYSTDSKQPEPWAPNAPTDPHAGKWNNLLAPGIDLPTTWPKQEFEQMEKQTQERRRQIRTQHLPKQVMEKLFFEERDRVTKLQPVSRLLPAAAGLHHVHARRSRLPPRRRAHHRPVRSVKSRFNLFLAFPLLFAHNRI